MFKLFLKIATRYLLKNKLYSFINIFGLAIGIASFVLIMLYVNYERSYDKFEGSENVHRVFMDYLEGGEYVPGDANAYIVSGPALKEEFPEIENFVRFRRIRDLVVLNNNTPYDGIVGSLADPEYFDVFDHGLVKGDVNTALNEPYSVVLSTSVAQKLFGDGNPIGQSLKIAGDATVTFTVTGVMDNTNRNTHIKNDLLISFKTFYTWKIFENDWKYTWNQNEYYTYVKVAANTDVELLNKKIMAFVPKGFEFKERHHMEPIESIHLYSNKPYEAGTNGNGNNIKLLSIIAFITLLLSWMNYMNLSSSKSLERAKEIGIRKVVGGKKSQLTLQFLSESALLNFMAILLALGAVFLLLPGFNAMVGQNLGLDGTQLTALMPYLGIMLLGASLAALYPAFVLSRFNPAKVLKGQVQTSKNGLHFRRALIITQFVATISLLICTLMANKQINFLKNRPIGANLDQVVALKGQILDRAYDSIFYKDFDVLLEELKRSPYVAEVGCTGTYPGDDFSNMNSNIQLTFPDGHTDETHIWYNYGARPNYFNLMGMDFVAGNAFLQTAEKWSHNVVVNEEMVRFMGIEDPNALIGETIKFWGQDWTVSGVVEDYNHFGMKSAVVPIIIRHDRNTQNVLVKLDQKAITMAGVDKALNELEQTWHQVFPVSTYNYTFLDQKFQALFNEDQKFAKAFQIFTLLAILIASLGLFGLTSYTCIQRKKEIGVRKVNGATIAQILQLLNQNFIKWVGLAFVIAVPIAWFAMDKWLEGFAYKTTISWWVFVLGGLVALSIAILTVSWQSFRAAIANPVESLRDE
ncbi:ABC transporter permease [Flagellimonas pacifica]|uniref:Putative ABC transport system permease protein n=1 Tax=Flagellimonas pacifica TaxID=1247520 RepID=A0A285MDZ0_9FLAO|nr:ABC transporter permease [Allomuricauda parva]SNY94923.1 putative ABC transport system permease protein [Allomuricauda parva]